MARKNQLSINNSNDCEMNEKTPLFPEQNGIEGTKSLRKFSYDGLKQKLLSRQPFIYNTMDSVLDRSEEIRRSAVYHRYKYIAKLSRHNTNMIIPDHMLPVELFLIIQGKAKAKQGSIVTIFSLWNTMMGSSILSIPWALSQAGFGFGVFLIIFMGAVCFFTSYLILKSSQSLVEHGEIVEFGDICKHHFGRVGEFVATSFSIITVWGAAVVFWVLMCTFLYSSGTFIHESSTGSFPNNQSSMAVLCPLNEHGNTSDTPNSQVHKSSFITIWNKTQTIPFFLIILFLPLCNIKSPTFFTKFNSLGSLAVMYIVIFVCVKASKWGINMDFSDTTKIPEFSFQFPALTGILALAYFVHNCILTIMRNQNNPKNNVRDLSIAYIMAVLTYVFVGSLFYAAFPIAKSCISQVFLDNIPASDIMAFVASVGLFFQLVTVFPLAVYIIRVQFMLYVFGKPYPGRVHVFILNVVIITCCVVCACYFPHVGTIIRYVGSLSGLVWIFALPCLVSLHDSMKEKSLSWPKIAIHSFVILVGVLNLISQFLIS